MHRSTDGDAEVLRTLLIGSMPFRYVRDHAKRRIMLTLTDPLTVAELLESAARQLAGGAWQDGLLVDARTTFVALQAMELRLFAANLRELIAAHGPRGPVAIVTQKSAATSAQMYHVFGGKTASFEVFWDLNDAQQWLDDRMTPGRERQESD
jgi:hypothetical protein